MDATRDHHGHTRRGDAMTRVLRLAVLILAALAVTP